MGAFSPSIRTTNSVQHILMFFMVGICCNESAKSRSRRVLTLCRMTMLTSLHLQFEWHCKPVGEIKCVCDLLEVKISGRPGLAFMNSLLSPLAHLRSLEQTDDYHFNKFGGGEANICSSSSSLRFPTLLPPSHPCKGSTTCLHS